MYYLKLQNFPQKYGLQNIRTTPFWVMQGSPFWVMQGVTHTGEGGVT